MMRTRVLVAGIVVGLLGLAGTTVSAQEPGGVSFEADTRIARAGNPVMLEAAGLTGCEGDLVELGFFGEGFEGDLWSQSRVGEPALVDDGESALVQLWPAEEATGLRAGVRGDCLEGGPVMGDLVLHVADPGPDAGTAPPEPGEPGPHFSWGEGMDRYGSVTVGDTTRLEVEGLEACAGETVELGFFAGLWGPDFFAPVEVDGAGKASVELVQTAPAGSADQRAGAIGDCLEGGFVLSDRSLVVFQQLPDERVLFRISTPQEYLDMDAPPAAEEGVETMGEYRDHLLVYADQQLCGAFSFVEPAARTADGDPMFEVGLEEQTGQCSKFGALITLENRFGQTLHEKLTFVPGGEYELANLAPEPPHGATAEIIVPAYLLGEISGGSSTDETIAEFYDHLVVFIDRVQCGTFSLTDPGQRDEQGNARFLLAGLAPPAACERLDAEITFEDRFGRLMHLNFTLEAGETYLFNNFAPVPPHHEPTPPPNAPGAPDAGTGFRVERGEFGPGLLAGAAVLGLGTLATVLAAVARSRRW